MPLEYLTVNLEYINIFMIDSELIEQCANSIKLSLEKRNSVNHSLSTIQKVLPENALLKLQKYIENSNVFWQTVDEGTYSQPNTRRKVTWDADTIVEELHVAFEKVTNSINKFFPSNQQQNFIGISLWKDTGGYKMDWHTDNPILSCAIQLYLFDTCPTQCGTTFIVDDNQVEIPFVSNSGYVAFHNVDEKLMHKASCIVPENVVRYSLYASWSLTKKLPG